MVLGPGERCITRGGAFYKAKEGCSPGLKN